MPSMYTSAINPIPTNGNIESNCGYGSFLVYENNNTPGMAINRPTHCPIPMLVNTPPIEASSIPTAYKIALSIM